MNRQSAFDWSRRFIGGILIGLGAIIPGVSGGVIAVAMGFYEKMLDAIGYFFRAPRDNINFLLPLGLGAGIGMLAFSKLVAWSMANYKDQIIFLFIGLIVGGMPSLVQTANSKGFKKRYLLPLLIAIGLILLPSRLGLIEETIQETENMSFVMGLFSGFVLALGTIAPGVSTSFILMYIGTYEVIIKAISEYDFITLFPVCVGFAVSALLIIKLIGFLFKRFYSYSYYTVIGFLIGSIILVFPSLGSGFDLVLNVLLFITGCVPIYLFERNKYGSITGSM